MLFRWRLSISQRSGASSRGWTVSKKWDSRQKTFPLSVRPTSQRNGPGTPTRTQPLFWQGHAQVRASSSSPCLPRAPSVHLLCWNGPQGSPESGCAEAATPLLPSTYTNFPHFRNATDSHIFYAPSCAPCRLFLPRAGPSLSCSWYTA